MSAHTRLKHSVRTVSPGIGATERPGPPAESPGQPAGFVASGSAGPLKQIDAVVRTGERLSKAVDAMSREQIKALADRLGLASRGSTMVLRIQVKRRLLGAGGLIRESRAKT